MCIRTSGKTSKCAYAQEEKSVSVRTHTSVRTHRYQCMTSLMKNVVLAILGASWPSFECAEAGWKCYIKGDHFHIKGGAHF
ncbi:uncharacterized protein DS421_20g694120 [Arachis hypogaea]|nr:uncharacterized protein DS421_20g694120 [Arachis hypogaea]